MVWETQRIECGLMRGREGQGWGLGFLAPGLGGSDGSSVDGRMDEFRGGRCWRSWRDDCVIALCISSSLGRPWSWTKHSVNRAQVAVSRFWGTAPPVPL